MAEEQQEKPHQAEHIDVKSDLKDVENSIITGPSLTPEEDRRILRRIDKCLLYVMALSYAFQFFDKSALGYSAILGLREDLKMTGSDFSWANAIYYFGYLAASYPVGFLIVRTPVGKMISASILVWGGILMFTALCFNAAGLLAIRFFLGVAESAIGPGLTVMIAMWYKRKEQPLRHGAWFLGNTLAVTFGGLVAYGVAHINTIASWKTVFLIFGGVTVLWSFFTFFLLPDTPMNARFLSPEDRAKAIKRVEENMTGIKNNVWKRHQFIEAVCDVKCWALILIHFCGNLANGGIQSFASIIIKGLGFSTLNTLLVQMLMGVFQATFVLMCTIGTTYIKNSRTYWMAWNLVISLVGAVMVRQLPSDMIWSRFIGYCLTIGYTGNFPMVLSMSSGNFGGFTKKTTVNAMIFIAYCAGNIVGPQLFFEDESPSYPSGFLAVMVSYSVGILVCFALRFYLIWENKRRDKVGGVYEVSEEQEDENLTVNLTDKTDKEIPQFRYLY